MKAGFYVKVDMPGVTKETVTVRVKDGRVLFAGEGERRRRPLNFFYFYFFRFFF